MRQILDEIDALRDRLLAMGEARTEKPPAGARPPHSVAELVTLDQAAATVRRSKRTLEKYRGRMPEPAVEGGGGRPHLYDWGQLRPWLEKTFGLRLPEHFPGAT